jgi:hypothetical protein
VGGEHSTAAKEEEKKATHPRCETQEHRPTQRAAAAAVAAAAAASESIRKKIMRMTWHGMELELPGTVILVLDLTLNQRAVVHSEN